MRYMPVREAIMSPMSIAGISFSPQTDVWMSGHGMGGYERARVEPCGGSGASSQSGSKPKCRLLRSRIDRGAIPPRSAETSSSIVIPTKKFWGWMAITRLSPKTKYEARRATNRKMIAHPELKEAVEDRLKAGWFPE